MLGTFEIVQTNFEIKNKVKKAQFFQKTFFLANTSVIVILGMFFLTFDNANILFAKQEFTWRSYTSAKGLLMIK